MTYTKEQLDEIAELETTIAVLRASIARIAQALDLDVPETVDAQDMSEAEFFAKKYPNGWEGLCFKIAETIIDKET